MGDDPEAQIAVLQERVRERLAALRALQPGDREYEPAGDAVIAVAAELIDYEQRLPVLLDQGPRRLTLLTVRWSGIVSGAVGIAIGVAASAGWLARWWLLVVVGVLAVGAAFLRLPVPPPCEVHLPMRPGAAVAAAGALVVAVGAAGHFPVWVAGAGLVVLVAGFLLCRRALLENHGPAVLRPRPMRAGS
jgi:hypothetical protein